MKTVIGFHNPLVLANFFVRKGIEEEDLVTHLKLQKLIYFAHGWHLALTGGTPLLDPRFPVEAWPYGPVIREVYTKYASFGREGIDEIKQVPPRDELTGEELDLLEEIWTIYGKFDGGKLSTITHQVGTPWHQVSRTWPGAKVPIDNELICEYFLRELTDEP